MHDTCVGYISYVNSNLCTMYFSQGCSYHDENWEIAEEGGENLIIE